MRSRITIIHFFIITQIVIGCTTACAGRFAAAGVDNDKEAIEYFNVIKSYVIAGMKEKLADEIMFPVDVYIKGKKITLKNKQVFIESYNDVINTKIINSFLRQTEKDLFASWQGVSTNGGEMWFSLVEDEKTGEWNFKVIAINNK